MTATSDRASHWDRAYDQGDTTRSWFQDVPAMSLALLQANGLAGGRSLIDIGGGASRLVDAALALGVADVAVLDVSAVALDVARARLGEVGGSVRWLAADLLEWEPDRTWDFWHDRAVFHFLTAPEDRERYRAVLGAATSAGSIAVIGCFAPDGPEYCSGLPVARYDAEGIAAELGTGWELIGDDHERHTTPSGGEQPFTWAVLRRLG
jgi:SAM-dependent methyltransferase